LVTEKMVRGTFFRFWSPNFGGELCPLVLPWVVVEEPSNQNTKYCLVQPQKLPHFVAKMVGLHILKKDHASKRGLVGWYHYRQGIVSMCPGPRLISEIAKEILRPSNHPIPLSFSTRSHDLLFENTASTYNNYLIILYMWPLASYTDFRTRCTMHVINFVSDKRPLPFLRNTSLNERSGASYLGALSYGKTRCNFAYQCQQSTVVSDITMSS
jgi:hypothetical protein